MLKIYHPTKTTMPVQVEDVKFPTSCITILCKVIMINIPLGNKRIKIHLVMIGEEVGDTWHTLNKYFDTLFAKIQQTCANLQWGISVNNSLAYLKYATLNATLAFSLPYLASIWQWIHMEVTAIWICCISG